MTTATFPLSSISLNASEIKYNDFDVIWVPRRKWDNAVVINGLVTSIEFSYSIDQSSVSLVVELENILELSQLGIDEGDYLVLFGYVYRNRSFVFEELYRNVIVSISRQINPARTYRLESLDPMFYAQRNKFVGILPEATATKRIQFLATTYGIPFDEDSDPTSFILPRSIHTQSSVYDIMLSAIVDTNLLEGQHYVFRFVNGKLQIKKRNIPDQIWTITESGNLYTLVRKSSISDMLNSIAAYGSEKKTSALGGYFQSEKELPQFFGRFTDPDSINNYGLMEEVLLHSSISSTADAKFLAEQRLKRKSRPEVILNIEASNINGLHWGDPIYVYEISTGSIGIYYIVSGTHRINASGAMMEVVLSLEDKYLLLESTLEQTVAPSTRVSPLDKLLGISKQSSNASSSLNRFLSFPFNGQYTVSQGFGNGHNGIDYAMPTGTHVLASASGVVSNLVDPDLGNYVAINHGNGFITIYAHLDSFALPDASTVNRGDYIANSGNTGDSTGPHLHHALVYNGAYVNIKDYML